MWHRSRILLALFAGVFIWLFYLQTTMIDLSQFAAADNSLRIEGEMTERGFVVIDVVDTIKVPLSSVSDPMQQALVAMEDRRFFEHFGLDLRGTARGIVRGLTGGRFEGGSTLTQQLVKNLALSSERTLARKVREILLSLRVDAEYGKEKTLEMYLNHVYFGRQAHGVEVAARTYFHKRARELTLYESAILVGSLPRPSAWNLGADPVQAHARARLVLDTMVRTGAISEVQARRARSGGLRRGVRKMHHIEHRYFLDWVRPQIETLLKGHQGRVTVYTTLDAEMQVYAERAVDRGLVQGRNQRARQGALVAFSVDGAVRALVGGRDYATGQWNRAVQAKRQPGSVFKLYVYLAALEAGWKPGQIVRDEPINVDGWTPKNIDGRYLGPISMEAAFSRSRNAATVWLCEHIGRARVREAARRVGLMRDLPTGPAVALGTGLTSLLELARGYGVMANGGRAVRPFGILGITDAAGRVLYWHPRQESEGIVEASVVRQMTRLLQAVLRPPGTGTRAALKGHPAAGKTGTTQRYRDAWFVGFTRHLVAGVWLGNDDETPMDGVTGGTHPSLIWRNFMADVHRYLHLPRRALDAAD